MKRLYVLALVGLLFLGVFSPPALADGDIVKVMTRNQYLGADLMPIVTAESPQDFLAAATVALEQIAANNFPVRARRLATEVALTKPDLIGLQEVYDFTVNGFNTGPPFVNHLDVTLTALNDRGQKYEVAAILNNMDITVHIEGIGSVRVLDRDVILVREGVTWENLSGSYITDGLCEVPIPNPAYAVFGPSLLMSTPSEDGCNYTIMARVDSPAGSITIERGFVGVDAKVRGRTYRFVNTHLEQRQPDPTDPISRILQFLQSVELIGTLQAITPPDLPLILLGDFNSSSEDEPIHSIIPPYQVIVGQDFADVWDTNPLARFDPEGLTCCEFADLSNRRSDHFERVDIIFVRDTSFLPQAFVTGRVPIFPLHWPPNWVSDHGGVFGKLIFRRSAMD